MTKIESLETDINKTSWECPDFSLMETLECGQCFRYEKLEENKYLVIASNKYIILNQDIENNTIYFHTTNEEDIVFWKNYFHGDGDYNEIKLTLRKNDKIMAEAIDYCSGIRLIKQDFFETLISFIISQNNHIPRIRKLIALLSEKYGTEIGENYFSFPNNENIKHLTEQDYRDLGFGFRGRYLEDAVKKSLLPEFQQEYLCTLNTEDLRKQLMTICGVGQKVADCILLFCFSRYEVFPCDVWIKRVFSYLYADNKELSQKELLNQASELFGDYAGFAQQYLFHYGRSNNLGK